MPFYFWIDRTERVLDLVERVFRWFVPKRPMWFKFSMACLLFGSGLLTSPFWVPLLMKLIGLTVPASDTADSVAPSFLSPEFWGGTLILAGLAIFCVMFFVAGEGLKLGPFVSTSVLKGETLIELMRRLTNRRGLTLVFEGGVEDDLNVSLPQVPISGKDMASMLRQLIGELRQVDLNNLYIVETRRELVVGKV